jgi:cyanate permease
VALLLAVVGALSLPTAIYFAVVSGMALGLLSPLHGLFQADVYGDHRLGTLSGATVITGSIAAATGALFTGVVFEATGSYRVPLIAVTAVHLLALIALRWQASALRQSQELGTASLDASQPEPAG